MTKDQIERYGGICDKIVALRSLKVRDTVQGSTSEIPYQKHTIVLEGRMEDGKNSKLQALKRQKAAIEAAVEAIEDETGPGGDLHAGAGEADLERDRREAGLSLHRGGPEKALPAGHEKILLGCPVCPQCPVRHPYNEK